METIQEASTGIAPIDGAKALELLRAAVQTRGPDYIYESPSGPRCVYESEGVPSCIVGVALSLHGVPIDVLIGWDTALPGVEAAIDRFKGRYEWLTDAAADVFRAAQSVQDRATWTEDSMRASCTWGVAFNAAEAELAAVSS